MRASLQLLLALLPLAAAQAQPPEHRHRVQTGDTLIGLQRELLRADVSWQALQRHTRVRDPYRLQPGSLLSWPQAWMRETPAQAEVLFALGQVELERQGQRRALQVGDTVQDGDWLHAGPRSSATLRFADHARLVLRPGTRLRIDRLTRSSAAAQTRVELREGAADSRVPPLDASARQALRERRFELLTPVANMGVRGTAFRSQVQNGQLQVEVLEGRVATRFGRTEQAVAAGQGLVSQGKAAAPEALLPAPNLQVPAVVERLPLRWSWSGNGGGASAYRLQLSDGQGEHLWLDARTTQPQWEGGSELPDGEYRLRVRAIAANGLEGQDAEAPFSLRARPEPPFLEAPAAAAQQYASRTDFRWTRSAAAHRYRLQIAADADFHQILHDRGDLSDTQSQLDLAEGSHHWRVASLRPDGSAGPWSDAQQLVRLPPPPAPAPAQSERQGDQLQLRWPASSLPGARYQLQAAASADFAQPWFDAELSEPQASLKPPGGGTQHLRMRTLSADGVPGPWGPTQSVDWPSHKAWWWLLLPALAWLL